MMPYSPSFHAGDGVKQQSGIARRPFPRDTHKEPSMSRNAIFVISLLVVAGLAGGVAYGMFSVGTFDDFEKSKLYFAAAVLAFLAFIFLLAMIFYAVGPEPKVAGGDAPGKAIFDACVKVIPPLVTLIIGFYFGASQSNDAAIQTAPATNAAPLSR